MYGRNCMEHVLEKTKFIFKEPNLQGDSSVM